MSQTVAARLDGLLPLGNVVLHQPTLEPHQAALNELEAQLRPFWRGVSQSTITRDDGVRVVHYWQPPEAPGGELSLYLEPTLQGWVCVNLDHDLSVNLVARARTLTDLVQGVCAALEVGLTSRGAGRERSEHGALS